MFAICKNKPYAGKNLTIISYQNNKLIQKIKTKEDDGSFELPNKFNKVEIICENSPCLQTKALDEAKLDVKDNCP